MKQKIIVLLFLVITLMITGCRKDEIISTEKVEIFDNKVSVGENVEGNDKFELSLNLTVNDVVKALNISPKEVNRFNSIGMDYFANQGYTDFSINGTLLPTDLPLDTYDGIYVIMGTVDDVVVSYDFQIVSPDKLIKGKDFLRFVQYEEIGDFMLANPSVRIEDGGLTEFVKFDYEDCCLVVKTFDMEGKGANWEDSVFISAVLISRSVLSDYDNKMFVSDGNWDYSEYAPAPFSMEEFWDLQEVEAWYDNGIFSTYMEMAYPTDEWEYTASIYPEMDNNPYGFLGFQIYTHQCEQAQQVYRYLVPITMASAPEVYSYDTTSNHMKRVFVNGELLE